MRASCQIVAEVLSVLKELVRPGITTAELDARAAAEAQKRKAKAAFKGYMNYPSSLCCSPNDQVVHGIPNDQPLETGDIVSLDFGVLYREYYGDAAITVAIGEVGASIQRLLQVTEESLYLGIAQAVPNGRLSDISHAVQKHVESSGFSVVRDFVGHGIGKQLHEDPQIPNFGAAGKGVKLKPGMVLAIEPMINQKSHEVEILSDGWTVKTKDGGYSAHFEHTVAITENGPDILTQLV